MRDGAFGLKWLRISNGEPS